MTRTRSKRRKSSAARGKRRSRSPQGVFRSSAVDQMTALLLKAHAEHLERIRKMKSKPDEAHPAVFPDENKFKVPILDAVFQLVAASMPKTITVSGNVKMVTCSQDGEQIQVKLTPPAAASNEW